MYKVQLHSYILAIHPQHFINNTKTKPSKYMQGFFFMEETINIKKIINIYKEISYGENYKI